jgi:hypothetical protein
MMEESNLVVPASEVKVEVRRGGQWVEVGHDVILDS